LACTGLVALATTAEIQFLRRSMLMRSRESTQTACDTFSIATIWHRKKGAKSIFCRGRRSAVVNPNIYPASIPARNVRCMENRVCVNRRGIALPQPQ
jgi:hypothetical protein